MRSEHIERPKNPGVGLLGFMLAAGAAMSLSGCNTVEGAGDDLEEASEQVQEEINDDDDDGY